MNYQNYEHKIPELILNIPGTINLENKSVIKIRFEIDYNSLSEEELNKIIKDEKEQFEEATSCITYNGKDNYNKENLTYIPIDINGSKGYMPIKTENNSINFKMIKKSITVLRNHSVITSTEINHSKEIEFSLVDGTYQFECNIFNNDNEFICTNYIDVNLQTDYYSMNDNQSTNTEIPFNKDEGDFKITLGTNTERLYSFRIADIISSNDNIFEFSYYDPSGNDKKQIGKIGSILNLLSEKQIDEIIKNPVREKLIKKEIVFDINEMFTTQHSKGDIGVVRFPTIRQKIKDNYLPYYNLSCDVTQNYSVDFDKDDLLITDKFKNYPLFYKFFIDTPFDTLKIIDSDNKEVTDFIVDKISDEVNIVYFNPLRNKEYYYILDNDPPLHIHYKRGIESYRMIFNQELIAHNNKLEFEYPMYFGDLMLKGNGIYDVEIQFADYTRKTFKLKAVDKEFKYLEDERIKVNNKILSLEIKTKDKVEVISMVCNFKHNRTNYSFFKSNFKDFVYIANQVFNIKISDIPENELSKFNINKKYILKDGLIEEVHNGPLYLEEIKKTDIVFTDIEEWLKEYSIGETTVVKTDVKDKFFLDNVINKSMLTTPDD